MLPGSMRLPTMMLAALLAALCLTNVAAEAAVQPAPVPSIAAQLRGYKAAAGALPTQQQQPQQQQAHVQASDDGYDEAPAVRLGFGAARGCNPAGLTIPDGQVFPLFYEQDLTCQKGGGVHDLQHRRPGILALLRPEPAVGTCDFTILGALPATPPANALFRAGGAKVACSFDCQDAEACDPALAGVVQLTADTTLFVGKAYSHTSNGTRTIAESCADDTHRAVARAAKAGRRPAKVAAAATAGAAAAAATPAGSYGRGEYRNPYYEHFHGRYAEHNGAVAESLYYGDVHFMVGKITAVSGPAHAQRYVGGSIEWVVYWNAAPVSAVTDPSALWIEGKGVSVQLEEAASGEY